jgi:hypothetical protein
LTPAALKARRAGLLAALLRRSEAREQIPGGYRLQFTPAEDLLSHIAEAIDAERQCCRFLRFVVTVEADEGPVSLELSGPAGTCEFLSALLDL